MSTFGGKACLVRLVQSRCSVTRESDPLHPGRRNSGHGLGTARSYRSLSPRGYLHVTRLPDSFWGTDHDGIGILVLRPRNPREAEY